MILYLNCHFQYAGRVARSWTAVTREISQPVEIWFNTNKKCQPTLQPTPWWDEPTLWVFPGCPWSAIITTLQPSTKQSEVQGIFAKIAPVFCLSFYKNVISVDQSWIRAGHIQGDVFEPFSGSGMAIGGRHRAPNWLKEPLSTCNGAIRHQ